MKKTLCMAIAIAGVTPVLAADLEAGKAKAATVCAACHGANGVSVSDSIPHLAAQREGYLAAHPGPQAGSKSGFLPSLAASRLNFPEGYSDTFTR